MWRPEMHPTFVLYACGSIQHHEWQGLEQWVRWYRSKMQDHHRLRLLLRAQALATHLARILTTRTRPSGCLPQGITSTANALDAGTYEGINGWIVSWYRDDDKSVRVTFVNRARDTYRHALLVYPHASDNFREVPGLVFDLTNIWQVGSGDDVGKVSSGVYSAAGYKYVIPQIRWYKWSSSFKFRHSYMALDRTTTPDSLIVGEYQTSTSDPIRLVRYELDYTTRRLKTDSSGGVSKAVWAYCVNIERMQGAVSANGKFYLSRSNGASKGDLWAWVPGAAAKKNAGFYPRSPEDLSYDKRNGGRLYTVTEAEGVRYIINSPVNSVSF
ncbi:hypothetical protein NEUTE2DRAFT_114850 [Neurospora tetrasperma FGSC 2509]|nr:hypothetical protein NEUTE2DRAFT_114850 [Neurospora tetrasperma FGSC 2509]